MRHDKKKRKLYFILLKITRDKDIGRKFVKINYER